MTTERYGDVWVCVDCYFAHHYGAHLQDFEPEEIWPGEYHDPHLQVVQLWFVGEADEPVGGWHDIRVNHDLRHNREPLGLLEGFEVADNTCSNHYYGQEPEEDEHGVLISPCDQCGMTTWEDGITDFSWSRCHGCGSHLGGSRYRLSLWKENV
jgi:hypothetical protein